MFKKIEGYNIDDLKKEIEEHNFTRIGDLLILQDACATPIRCVKHYYITENGEDLSKEADTDRVCYNIRKKFQESSTQHFSRLGVRECDRCHLMAMYALEHDGFKRNTEALKKKNKQLNNKKKKKRLVL